MEADRQVEGQVDAASGHGGVRGGVSSHREAHRSREV